jgi:hypothetical protein
LENVAVPGANALLKERFTLTAERNISNQSAFCLLWPYSYTESSTNQL